LDDIQSWINSEINNRLRPITPLLNKILYNYEQKRNETETSFYNHDGRRELEEIGGRNLLAGRGVGTAVEKSEGSSGAEVGGNKSTS